jgi:hypothetical protein
VSNEARREDEPYGSAMDLPTVVDLTRQMAGMKALTRIVGRSQRAELLRLERQLHDIVAVVDGFYAVLGARGWVFHERLDLEAMRGVAGLESAGAEAALIDYYRSGTTLDEFVRHLMRFPALRVRGDLLRAARADYAAGRFYAAVLVLLSVMDGFVNDLDPAERRGLHARAPEDLHAWDSVVGHHRGLGAAHRSFVKSVFKTSEEEVHDLNRNGIVHGTLINYNNAVVATKAWNRIFAVADWAESRERSARPPEQPVKWRDLFRQIAATAKDKAELESWRPSVVSADDAGFDELEVCRRATAYLDGWRSRNFGAMAGHLPPAIATGPVNQTAGMVRATFADHEPLMSYRMVSALFGAAPVCEIDVELEFASGTRPARMRWILEAPDGRPALPGRDGSWFLYLWGPWAMLEHASDPRLGEDDDGR